ncbi:polymer-forming cytoskeletal protein [Aliikangiella marina]|uniref:Polymer-forming cytoskeletal protein n=1 Tax=Aliikangiella marina TaxID=1712262 RepID=A0A545THS0_9GAMM|nr:polymer-forming cytoskeletal protein [Aliikangiella marina]TQV76745.1 polymer-forming cytoskeletal protein [Aliikangiella marina]
MKLKSSDNPFFTSTSDNNDSEPQAETVTSAQPASIQEAKPSSSSQSVIGGNIKFRGELIGTEDIHIEGTVEGTIIMEGHNLTIGSQGTIDANVHANNITINGNLNGDVLADELISIKKSAKVKGNLIAPRIQLDDGGKFRGSMDMIDNEQEKKDCHNKFKEKLVHPHLPEKSASNKPEPAASTMSNQNAKKDKKQD